MLSPLLLLSNIGAVNAQAAPLGGGAPGANAATDSVVTTTTYLNAPTAAQPPINQGPWSDKVHLEGTWSSKSMMVMTGPDFYDPVDELLIEPALPGISFSFTRDGFWEQAMYQVTGDGRNSSCSTGALTFQHGTYNISDEGKLYMTPFEDDGRQLVSEPCKQNFSEYVFYEQELVMAEFKVWVDLYYGRYRLDLYQWDGTPMPPMYLVYRPPQMLPTITMNPGVKQLMQSHGALGSSAPSSTSSASANSKRNANPVRDRIKRSLINRSRTNAKRETYKSPLYDTIWWSGVGMIVLGATGWICLA